MAGTRQPIIGAVLQPTGVGIGVVVRVVVGNWGVPVAVTVTVGVGVVVRVGVVVAVRVGVAVGVAVLVAVGVVVGVAVGVTVRVAVGLPVSEGGGLGRAGAPCGGPVRTGAPANDGDPRLPPPFRVCR